MWDEFKLYHKKRSEAEREYGSKRLQEMDFKNYTWEEWKRYYRKKNGHPEDGIKRIPFDGKRKERIIDWGPRRVFTKDEIAKYDIKMSKLGPIKIPIENAMRLAKELFDGAEQIHSIRDGLEAMRLGLSWATDDLK